MRLIRTMPAAGAADRRGGVLVMALVAVGVVASLSIGYLQLSAAVTRRQVGASDTKMAFYLAEAGLAEAYAGIMVGHTGAIGSQAAPAVLGEGLVWVEATDLDADHVELESIGMARSGKARLAMVIRRGTPNLGGLGVFSEQGMTIGDGSLIDGYDSTGGTYADQAALDPALVQQGTVRSNGDVTIVSGRTGTTVNGDVTAGPTGQVILSGTPTITGATGSAAALVNLAAPQPPAVTMFPGVSQPAGAPLVVPSGVYGAQFLQLQAGAEAILQGPLTLVLDGLQVSPGADLTLDTTNGPIELYVANAIDLDPGSFLTCSSQDATQVTVHATGAAVVSLEATSQFYGLLDAPDASVGVGGDFELFGGVVAESLTLAAGVALHHDRALIATGAEDALPKLLSWRILELPEESRDTVNVDPFAVLGVNKATCPPPADAHEDQQVAVVYYDATATLRTYSGLESGFNWGDVRQVVELRRSGGLVLDDVVRLAYDGSLGFLLP